MLLRTNKPRAGRIQTTFASNIEVDGGPTIRGLVLNISKSGFRLRLDSPLAVGDRIVLECESVRSKGQIVWAHGTEAGGRFLGTLDVESSVGRL